MDWLNPFLDILQGPMKRLEGILLGLAIVLITIIRIIKEEREKRTIKLPDKFNENPQKAYPLSSEEKEGGK